MSEIKWRSFLDSHCHLQDPRVESFREEWLVRAKASGITEFALGGVGPDDWKLQESLNEKIPNTFYLSAGLHPWWVAEHSDAELDAGLLQLRSWLEKSKTKNSRWIGLGETGLDHQDRFSPDARLRQRRAFDAQLLMADEFDLPLVLHVVRAHEDTLHALETYSGKGGMVHSFSAALPLARAYLKKGFLLSLSAAVLTRGTGKAFRSLVEVVLEMKLSDLLLETDAPDQPPADEKGQLNVPENLIRVAKIVAELKKCSAEEVLAASTENWKKKFL